MIFNEIGMGRGENYSIVDYRRYTVWYRVSTFYQMGFQ